MVQKVDPLEVKMWVERLRNSKTDEEAARAASGLSHLRMRTRGTVRTRGGGSRKRLPVISRPHCGRRRWKLLCLRSRGEELPSAAK